MANEEKHALAEQAYQKALRYELDYVAVRNVFSRCQETVGFVDDNTIKASHGLSGGAG